MRIGISVLLVAAPLALAACGGARTGAGDVTRAGPGPSYSCIVPQLPGIGVRQRTETTPDGWRMTIEAFSGPPAGWYDKGRIEYATGTLTYIPNSATLGIADEQVKRKLRPLLANCGKTARR